MGSPTMSGPRQGAGFRPQQLPTVIAEQLRARIMTGQIKAGTFIRLDETAAAYSVSVTPVREALLQLRGEGLVRLTPRRGFMVESLTREDVVDVFWVQATLAQRLANRALQQRDSDLVDELRRCSQRFRAAVQTGVGDQIADAEFEFHRTINSASGSRKLAWFLANAVRYTPHNLYASDAEWGKQAADNHDALVQAIADGDADRVASVTAELFDDGCRRLIAQLEASGAWD